LHSARTRGRLRRADGGAVNSWQRLWALPALQRLKEEGKVRHIGITGYPMDSIRYLAEKCPPGIAIESCLSYSRYNLHDTSLISSGVLARLTELGIGVINGSPYSMGLLVSRGPPAWHPAKKSLKERCARAAASACDGGGSAGAPGCARSASPTAPTPR
jgi:L-galactose dehydrogenase